MWRAARTLLQPRRCDDGPVVADYQNRDKLVAFWEKAENEHIPAT